MLRAAVRGFAVGRASLQWEAVGGRFPAGAASLRDVAAGAAPGPGRRAPLRRPPLPLPPRSQRACSNSLCRGSPSPFGCTVWWLQGIAGSSHNCSVADFFQKTGSCCHSEWAFRCGVCYVDRFCCARELDRELDFACSPVSFSFFSEGDCS